MNKNLQNILVGAILIVGIIAIVIYVTSSGGSTKKEECPPPPLPAGVPTDAYWSGGCAGGNWIYMVADSSNHYRFQVFSDNKGKLQIDTQFAPDSVATVNLNRTNWKDYKLYYQEGLDSLVYIVVASPTDTMQLHSTYPAYGGEIWENLKGVYDNIPQTADN